LVQICNFAAPNKKIFTLRGSIHENTSAKHPLSIDTSNIMPLAIMTLKRQTGSMDSFHASWEGLNRYQASSRIEIMFKGPTFEREHQG
jgi:hypothetical protein